MKNTISIILSLIMILSLFIVVPLSASAAVSGDFAYKLNDDGAVITRYIGSEGEITIPSKIDGYTVNAIGDSAFYESVKPTRVIIPDSVTSIGDNAFSYCSNLTSVTLPDSVTSIGEYAFFYCSSLISVKIPDSVISIRSGTFSCCDSLTSVDIPNSVKSIESYAFLNCSSLTSVDIPDSVASIGLGAFEGCGNLTSIAIPDSVTSIDANVFLGTAWYYHQPYGLVYAGKFAYEMKGDCPSDVVIKDGTLGIASSAFANCSSLNSVTIPDSVSFIGERAFSQCTNLTKVSIGNSVTTIDTWAFLDCYSLFSVILPSSVTSIGYEAIGYYYEDMVGEKVVDDFTIYGYKGTAAEAYANDNRIAFAEVPPMLGDVDGDREVEIRDATWIQRKVASMDLPFTFVDKRADVDGNNEITIMDATYIQRYLANLKTDYQIGQTVSLIMNAKVCK